LNELMADLPNLRVSFLGSGPIRHHLEMVPWLQRTRATNQAATFRAEEHHTRDTPPFSMWSLLRSMHKKRPR